MMCLIMCIQHYLDEYDKILYLIGKINTFKLNLMLYIVCGIYMSYEPNVIKTIIDNKHYRYMDHIINSIDRNS